MTTYKVGYLIGSLAKASINRKLAKALVRLAPAELEMTEIPFKDLPLYSYDYDADYPAGRAAPSRTRSRPSDAVLFVTPEYNRSIPGGLKNAIDWASRPYGQNSFARKPSAVIGTSPGAIGTAVAQQQPAQRARLLQLAADELARGLHPVQAGPDHRRRRGHRRSTEEFLRDYMAEFHAFIASVLSVLPPGCVRHTSQGCLEHGRCISWCGTPTAPICQGGEAKEASVMHALAWIEVRDTTGGAWQPPRALKSLDGGLDEQSNTHLGRRCWIIGFTLRASRSCYHQNFLLRTTQDLVELCGAPRNDPLFSSANPECHGFLLGVYQYDEALTSGRNRPPIICVQTGGWLTRDDAAQLFVAWMREHPHLMNEKPVDGLMRWAVEAWPCR